MPTLDLRLILKSVVNKMSPTELALKAQQSRSEYIRAYAQLILGGATFDMICKVIQNHDKRYIGLMPSQITQLKELEAVLDYETLVGRHGQKTVQDGSDHQIPHIQSQT